MQRGLMLITTGAGKGKTTAAMGMALRAVGNGMNVLMLQFLKGSWHYGELDAAKAFTGVGDGDGGSGLGRFEIRQLGRGFGKGGNAETDPADVRMVREGWEEARREILSDKWEMVVLDEINYAISYGFITAVEVAETLKARPERLHVILTGRNASPVLVEMADTVTEMKEVKHAYQKGIQAALGIEY